jgi:hypothetical protein
MRRAVILFLAALLAVSCLGRPERVKVDIDKALKKKFDVRKLYKEVTAIPLHCPEGKTLAQDGKVVLEVAADRFFLLDQNEILAFNGAGDYLTSIKSEEKIIDFSVYRDQVLDILTAEAIIEYDIKDCALLETYPIRDNDVILTSIARVDDDSISMTGYRDGTAYDCGYLVNRAYFYAGPRPAPDYLATHAYVPAEEMQRCRFFRCDGLVYNFIGNSGWIFRYTDNDFIFPAHQWDFGNRSLTFTNAQKTADRIYLAFNLDGKDYVLIYNLNNGKYQVVDYQAFPLGVIYAGSNYHCRPEGNGWVIVRYML